MNKILNLFLFALFLSPLTASSATIDRFCFVDSNGSSYDFRGGKLGKKAYLVRLTSSICSSTTMMGMATFAEVSNGHAVTILISRHPDNPFCDSFLVSALVDPNLITMSGNIDFLPRNSPPDLTFSATRVMCGPLAPTAEQTVPDSKQENVNQ